MKYNKGFSLLELLVVVLIIGILAAIALPQYRFAVGKTKLAELKLRTKTLSDSIQNYYLVNNEYPLRPQDLDADFQNNNGGITCDVMKTAQYIACNRTIFGKQISYYVWKSSGKPYYCYVWNTNRTHPANLLCEKDTGDHYPNCTTVCPYRY